VVDEASKSASWAFKMKSSKKSSSYFQNERTVTLKRFVSEHLTVNCMTVIVQRTLFETLCRLVMVGM
jgi:hypothetical protein